MNSPGLGVLRGKHVLWASELFKMGKNGLTPRSPDCHNSEPGKSWAVCVSGRLNLHDHTRFCLLVTNKSNLVEGVPLFSISRAKFLACRALDRVMPDLS